MIVDRLLLSTCLPATTADDASRPALAAIQVINGGPNVTAVGTNGHVLIRASAPVSRMPDAEYPAKGPELLEAHSALVPAGVAADAIKATRGRRTLPILGGVKVGTTPAGETIAVTTDLERVQTHDITNRAGITFPAVERVVASAEALPAVVTVAIGVPVLEALIKAAKAGSAKVIKLEIPANNDKRGYVVDAFRASWCIDRDPSMPVLAIAMPFNL